MELRLLQVTMGTQMIWVAMVTPYHRWCQYFLLFSPGSNVQYVGTFDFPVKRLLRTGESLMRAGCTNGINIIPLLQRN